MQGNKNNEILKRLDSNKSEDFNRLSSVTEKNPTKISKIQESLKYLTND